MTKCACDLDNDKMCMLHRDLDAETLGVILTLIGDDFCPSVNYAVDEGRERTRMFTSKTAAQAFVRACDKSKRYKVIEYQGFTMPENWSGK